MSSARHPVSGTVAQPRAPADGVGHQLHLARPAQVQAGFADPGPGRHLGHCEAAKPTSPSSSAVAATATSWTAVSLGLPPTDVPGTTSGPVGADVAGASHGDEHQSRARQYLSSDV